VAAAAAASTRADTLLRRERSGGSSAHSAQVAQLRERLNVGGGVGSDGGDTGNSIRVGDAAGAPALRLRAQKLQSQRKNVPVARRQTTNEVAVRRDALRKEACVRRQSTAPRHTACQSAAARTTLGSLSRQYLCLSPVYRYTNMFTEGGGSVFMNDGSVPAELAAAMERQKVAEEELVPAHTTCDPLSQAAGRVF
jgi:hypothetical protein